MVRFLDFFTKLYAIKEDSDGNRVGTDTHQTPITFVTNCADDGDKPYEIIDLDNHPNAELLKYARLDFVALIYDGESAFIAVYLNYDDVINIATLPDEQYSDTPNQLTVADVYNIISSTSRFCIMGVCTDNSIVTSISVETERPVSKEKCEPYLMITPSDSIIQIPYPGSNATYTAYEGTE